MGMRRYKIILATVFALFFNIFPKKNLYIFFSNTFILLSVIFQSSCPTPKSRAVIIYIINDFCLFELI